MIFWLICHIDAFINPVPLRVTVNIMPVFISSKLYTGGLFQCFITCPKSVLDWRDLLVCAHLQMINVFFPFLWDICNLIIQSPTNNIFINRLISHIYWKAVHPVLLVTSLFQGTNIFVY